MKKKQNEKKVRGENAKTGVKTLAQLLHASNKRILKQMAKTMRGPT